MCLNCIFFKRINIQQMAMLTKVVVTSLSITVFMCLLYAVTLSSNKNVSTVRADTIDGLESISKTSSRNNKYTSSSEGPKMTTAKSTQVTSPSSATSRRPPTTASTTPHVTMQEHKPTSPPPYNILYLIQTEQCIPPYFKLNDVFRSPNLG